MKNLIKIAKFLDSVHMHEASDSFIRVVAQSQFQPIKPSQFEDKIKLDRTNPISIWADPEYYAAVKGLPGSGTYMAEPDILKTLEGVPPRFKNMELDDVMREINNIIPAYNPSVHGSFDNYRRFILSSILDKPERREFVEDAEKLMKVFRSYLASKVLPKSFSSDPEANEKIKEGIQKILIPEDSSSPLSVAYELIQSGETPSSIGRTEPARGSLPDRSTNRNFSRGGGPGITSPFGNRDNPNNPGTRQFHSGVDLPASLETPVKAAMAGRVIFAGEKGSYGIIIQIEHPGGFETRYAHLFSVSVSVGQEVTAGQVIGKSGDSGNATGPHLHFELRSKGSPIDPTSYASRVL